MYELTQAYERNSVEPAVMLGIETPQSELYKKPIEDYEPDLSNISGFEGNPPAYMMGVKDTIKHVVVQTVLETLL